MLTPTATVPDAEAPWTTDSWRSCPALQQPAYDDPQALGLALDALGKRPALVAAERVLQLKALLAQAQQGRRFVLQLGDCAERFEHNDLAHSTRQVALLQQMSQVLMHGLQLPIVQIGRLAGQYAKPRSSDMENRNGVSLPAYRGDIVNHHTFSPEARRADPQRMLQAHAHSALTLDHLHSVQAAGIDNLLQAEGWPVRWLDQAADAERFRPLLAEVHGTLRFMRTLAGSQPGEFLHREMYVSHEALLLEYEHALTRRHADGRWFNLATHLPWIGLRTAQPEGAHVEYLRGLANPLAVKVGIDSKPAQLLHLLARLNPSNEPGRLTLIHRLGASHIQDHLPPLIETVRSAGAQVLWLCDPMHGNTRTLPCGTKTRAFDDILAEVAEAFAVHGRHGSVLGGLHLEASGDAVTECLGGAVGLQAADLGRRYLSQVDPRLNRDQSLELALRVSLDAGAWRQRP
ncbi:3-deoxy-7-phosphoheptulonate synthase [Pseudomonas putida]|uniref:3-deoxy-7-phosphoheptulonate synthase class II n=1 Tax=Pseudomonas putida TaxID=303 RepID=UPI000DB4DD1C|nr:3-deoxy-7-phosphoheptulonate synthase class II [Pseudomonas putida]MBI6942883.1 3-deoxy-7-phosphoheptulonate synthase [Pseudomonas putida]MBI6960804.1 3-deoxy-7-phosphoheptulonate synthase [Pseudomonas putida]PZQ40041.1 MAG: 3-deoxy-7-phosphoheptulonate synthase class II [Pseudomonas putida]